MNVRYLFAVGVLWSLGCNNATTSTPTSPSADTAQAGAMDTGGSDVTICTSDIDCDMTQVCLGATKGTLGHPPHAGVCGDPVVGHAGDPCFQDTDCDEVLTCVGVTAGTLNDPPKQGVCTPDQKAQDGEACSSNADCDTGLTCFGGRARDGGAASSGICLNAHVQQNAGEGCFDSVECAFGLTCVGVTAGTLNVPPQAGTCQLKE
jgi:hypothetical protein